MFGVVYKLTNKHTGLSYVGQTTQPIQTRKHFHQFPHSRAKPRKIERAIMKYGIDAFDIEVLVECSSQSELDEKECQYIQELDTINNGYNTYPGGKTRKGIPYNKKNIKC